jgi:hypothetical protein
MGGWFIDTETYYHPRGSGPPYEEQFKNIETAYRLINPVTPPGGEIRWLVFHTVGAYFFFYVEDPNKRDWEHVVPGAPDEDELHGDFENILAASEAAGDVGIVTNPIIDWWEAAGQYGSEPWTPKALAIREKYGFGREEAEWQTNEEYKALLAADQIADEAWKQGEFAKKPLRQVWNEIAKAADSGWHWLPGDAPEEIAEPAEDVSEAFEPERIADLIRDDFV